MIEPVQSDDALLADIQESDRRDGKLRLWWLGQSGFLLQHDGAHVLLDPYLSESLTKKYAGTDKPHVRLTRRPIDPARLDMIDIVTSSHNHTDHLDAETLSPLMHANPDIALVAPAANIDFVAERLDIEPARILGLDAGQSLEVKGVTLFAVPAAHEALETDEHGRHRFLGYVVQLGPWTIYHSGDTVRYEGMQQWLDRWRPDVALLPINGSLPERRVSGNLWGREAAELAKDIEAKTTIPCHYEMFGFNTVSPEQFVEAADELGIGYRVLRCGEKWEAEQPTGGG